MKPNLNPNEVDNIKEVVYKGKEETAYRECKHCGPTLFRHNAQKKWICISCAKRRTVQSRVKKKHRVMEENGGKCNRCGFSDLRALEWHHTNPLMGDREGYTKLNSASYTKLKEHVEEHCELLCANCHRIHHQEDGSLNYKNY